MGCGVVNAEEVGRNQETVLTLNRIYQRKELIGSGSYGKVYRCINKLNGQEYALKVVEITAKSRQEAVRQISSLKAQIGVLKKLSHDNIVKYYSFDIANDSKQVQIVLEYAKKGSLKQYIQERDHLQQKEAAFMVAQILRGLKYLHQQNIVHRDLKCANILMMEDGTLKISDFGTAKAIRISTNEDIARLCNSLKGTPYYMAPEVLKRTGHNISADIWSLGCLVIQMVSGKAPWTALTQNFQEIISYVMTGIHPPFPKSLSQECQCFLESCLDSLPSMRLTAEELLMHRWIENWNMTDKWSQPQKDNNRGTSSLRTKDCEILEHLVEENHHSNKKKMKEQKIKEIDKYISERSNGSASKRKMSSQRNGSKQKKDRSASIKLSDTNLNLVEEQIDISPHIDPVPIRPIQASIELRPKQKREELLKVTKTAPQMKLPQDVIEEIKELDEQSIEVSHLIIKQYVPESSRNHLKTDSSGDLAIDTHISRQQRTKYIQQQKQMREQRDQQKKRWERQLKEGADYLRKEITNRYYV